MANSSSDSGSTYVAVLSLNYNDNIQTTHMVELREATPCLCGKGRKQAENMAIRKICGAERKQNLLRRPKRSWEENVIVGLKNNGA